MKPPRIGLVGKCTGAGLRRLSRALKDAGAEVRSFDLWKFPHELILTVEAGGIRVAASGSTGEGKHNFKGLSACYVERGEYMSPINDWVPSEQEWPSLQKGLDRAIRSRQEARSVRTSVLRLLSRDCPMVNAPSVHRLCLFQPYLLRLLEARGLSVAPFISGNDLERMAYFVDGLKERCRVRRLTAPVWDEARGDLAYLKRHHADLDHFPLLLRQAMGGARFSALVVGGKCLGTALISARGLRPGPAALPDGETLAVRAAEAAGAHFALVHLERDRADKPWIVGLDGAPGVVQLEEDARLPVIETLAGLLLELAGARTGSASSTGPPPGRAPETEPPPGRAPRTRPPRIGLAGQLGNQEVFALKEALEDRGAEPRLTELPLFPDRRALHESMEGGRIGNTDLADLDALFLRTTGVNSPLPGENEGRPTAEQWRALYPRFARFPGEQGECFIFKYALLEILGRKIPVINPPLGQEVHRNKIAQLFSLRAAGLPVPPTIAGNDLERCAAFVKAQGGEDRVVLKPLAGIYKTCLLSEVGLEKALEQGPVILQRYIRGDTIRAYIVGGKLAGAGRILYSGESVDSSVGQSGVEAVSLPPEVVRAGWAAANHLGLSWSGMDFMRAAEGGAHYILECNAAAMFAGFSRMTGFDVPGALAELLIGLARGPEK